MSQKGSRTKESSAGAASTAFKKVRTALLSLLGAGDVVLELGDDRHAAFAALTGSGITVLEVPQSFRGTGTKVVADLGAVSATAISRVDSVVVMTPWHRIENGAGLLERVATLGGRLICRTSASREGTLAAAAVTFGLVVTGRAGAGGTDIFLRLEYPRAVAVDQPVVRPIVVIAGFYGRGNCGDEALFQTIYETFAPDFDVIVAVDSFGAVEGFQDWYPYNRCEIRHQCDLELFNEGRPIAAMMIGGGGLAIGFAANLVFEARARGIPTFISGVDLPGLDMPGCDPPDRQVVRGRRVIDVQQMKAYLGGFSRVMVRTRHGLDICRQLGIEADYGADWAIRLIQDEAEDVADSSRRALIVLREFPLHLVPYSYVLEIQALVEGLRAQGWQPVFLPFCPEDARNTAELDLNSLAPTLAHWWNPRRVKQLISASGLVIGVGRLHPLIFAASLGVPTVSLVPPLLLPSGRKSITKIDAICADWGLSQFATVTELLYATAGPLKGVSRRKLAAAQGRLERSIASMMGIIASYRSANSI